MKATSFENVIKAQANYLEILLKYEEYFRGNVLEKQKILGLFDEIDCFWLRQVEIINYEVEEIVNENTCFLLSGDIFLRTLNFDHYYFITFGDWDFLNDPIMKMEPFFRVKDLEEITTFTLEYFQKVFLSTIELLRKFPGYFIILPVKDLTIDAEQIIKLSSTFFWRIISSIFNNHYDSFESFRIDFHSYEDIENKLSDDLKKKLIINDFDDINLSLRKRIEKYNGTQIKIHSSFNNLPEEDIFLNIFFSNIAQILDILVICLTLRVYPFVKNDITAHYLTLISPTFSDDPKIKSVIENALIFFIFYKIIPSEKFNNVDFKQYCNAAKRINHLSVISDKINEKKISILDLRAREIAPIIEAEFEKILLDIL
jgi:hypothetical protein